MKRFLSSLVLSVLLLGGIPGVPVVEAQSKQEYSRVLDDPFDKYSFTNVMTMVNTIKNQGNITYDTQNKIVSGLPTGHPRIFITPANRTALNQKIASHYVSWMQEFVDLVDAAWGQDVLYEGRASIPPPAQILILTCGMIHQLGAIPGVTYANPIAEYGPEGVRHLVNLAPVDTYYHNEEYLYPLGYDWLYDLMTPAQRQVVVDELMDIADLNNHTQVINGSSPPGSKLLGALAVYGDWDHVSESEVNQSLDHFHNGLVFGDIADLPVWQGTHNFAGSQIFTPQGPGHQGPSYAGWNNPFYSFLLTWRNQTGEDYFQLSMLQNWPFYYTHATGNEYEHQDKFSMLLRRPWLQGLRDYLDVFAQIEVGLTPSNTNGAALLKYHRNTGGMDQFISQANRVLYMLLSDPNLEMKSPEQLALPTSTHVQGVNSVFARDSWSGIDSTWIQFSSPTWTSIRDQGPLNDIVLWKNGGMLLGKHLQVHDYDGGNRANIINLYSENHPDKTFSPQNVMDKAASRSLGLSFKSGDSYAELDRNLLGYHEGLEYYEELPGEYLYTFGDGAQRFDALKDDGDCCEALYINLDQWSRQFVWFREVNSTETEYFIVLDRIDAPQGTQPHLRWNFNMNPEIQDRVTSVDKGAGQELMTGIYKYSDANRIKISNTVTTDWGTANTRMFMDTLLPKNVDYYRMGGVTERNIDLFGNLRPRNLRVSGDPNNPQNILDGMWRVQVADQGTNTDKTFLHVLQATDTAVSNGIDTVLLEGAGVIGAAVEDKMALFSAAESTINVGSVTIPAGAEGTYDVLIADLEPSTEYDIEFGAVTHDDIASSAQGVLYFQDVTFSAPSSTVPDSWWKRIARFVGLDFVYAAASNQIKVTKGNAVPDTEAPVISSVQVMNIGSSSAQVLWSTNEIATSRVDYGLTTSYGSTVSSASLVRNHSMVLSGLSPLTKYHFRVRSADASGNTADSAGHTFTTTDNDPPVVFAGTDQSITSATATLDGTVTDDGLPNPPGVVTTQWRMVSGPGTVTFGDPSAVDTTATLSAQGTYVLELSGNDGGVTRTDTVAVTYSSGGGGGGTTPCGVSGSVDLTNGLIGHWTFDEGSGNTAADSSGNGYDATLVNAPVWNASGRIGASLSFDGVEDYGFVPTDTSHPLSSPGPMTYAFWVKPGAKVDAQGMLFKGNGRWGSNTTSNIHTANVGNPHAQRIALYDENDNSSVISSTTNLPVDEWTHVIWMRDGTDVTYCINGKQDLKRSQTLVPRTTDGRLTFGSIHGLVSFYQGEMDDVCVYNRVLNAEEATTLASGQACANPPELCIMGALENRVMDGESRMDLPSVSVTLTDTVTSTVVKDVVVPMDVSGKISLTDLTGVSDSATYDIAVRPHGLLSKTLSNQTNVISGGCIDAGTFLLIDANGDGLLGLADLVGFVNYYRTLVHGTLEGVFAYLRPGVNHLVRAVANFIAQQ